MSTLAETRSCPHCAAPLNSAATKCPSCGEPLPDASSAETITATANPPDLGETRTDQAAPAPDVDIRKKEVAAARGGPGVVGLLVPVASPWAVLSSLLAFLSALPLIAVAAFYIILVRTDDPNSVDAIIAFLAKPMYIVHAAALGAGFLAIVTGLLTFWHCRNNPRRRGKFRAIVCILASIPFMAGNGYLFVVFLQVALKAK